MAKKKISKKANKKIVQKTFLGAPMNWDFRNALKPNWNKKDSRLFPPKTFGIGWTINFHELLKRLKFIQS